MKAIADGIPHRRGSGGPNAIGLIPGSLALPRERKKFEKDCTRIHISSHQFTCVQKII